MFLRTSRRTFSLWLTTRQFCEKYAYLNKIRKYSVSSNKCAAFVFDIDGVLIRGKQVLEPAKKALLELYKSNRYSIAFLTNGGGCTEAEKAEQLSEWFHLPIQPDQIVLSHSPLREISTQYNDNGLAVVCVGRGHPDVVAYSCGFRYVIPIEEIGRLEPTATPFCDYEKVPRNTNWQREALDYPVGGILVLSDSTDWGRDIQIICDILLSRSCLVFSKQFDVKLYFTNPDFLWANEFPFPRFGQGAFRLALESIYQQLTGKPLPYIQYGKPCTVQYRFMENLLRKQALSKGYTDLEVIYAIGDNPAADIRGARNAGRPWIPILVRTGCFSSEDGDNDPRDPADYVFQDVNEAVKTLAQRE